MRLDVQPIHHRLATRCRNNMCRLARSTELWMYRSVRFQQYAAPNPWIELRLWLASAAYPTAPSAHTPGHRELLDIRTHADHPKPRFHVTGLADRCGRRKNGPCATWAPANVEMPRWTYALHTILGGIRYRVLCGVLDGCRGVQKQHQPLFRCTYSGAPCLKRTSTVATRVVGIQKNQY